ncbi:hypothetical protein [Arthrobacter sp.]
MRILHTSDWHLGRSFHGAGLLEANAASSTPAGHGHHPKASTSCSSPATS